MKTVGGSIWSKFCGLGQAGFPLDILSRRRGSGFPLYIRPSRYHRTGPDYHSVHTAILQMPLLEQSRGFPRQQNQPLASFATLVSKTASHPPKSLKAGYAVHSFLTKPPNRFNPWSWLIPKLLTYRVLHRKGHSSGYRPKAKASTVKGSTPTCHCGSPLNLNSQHQPTAGRGKQTQGTSSMCP